MKTTLLAASAAIALAFFGAPAMAQCTGNQMLTSNPDGTTTCGEDPYPEMVVQDVTYDGQQVTLSVSDPILSEVVPEGGYVEVEIISADGAASFGVAGGNSQGSARGRSDTAGRGESAFSRGAQAVGRAIGSAFRSAFGGSFVKVRVTVFDGDGQKRFEAEAEGRIGN